MILMDKMDRKIKYALQMGDGVNVRTLEDLRKHFDFNEVTGYYVDHKLIEWLEDRYYDDVKQNIEALDDKDPDFARKFCQVFGVEWKPSYVFNSDQKLAYERKEDLVKQTTTDPLALRHVKSLAMNQEELEILLTSGMREIYLLGDAEEEQSVFTIPVTFTKRSFIGVGGRVFVDFKKDGKRIPFDQAEREKNGWKFSGSIQIMDEADEKEDSSLLSQSLSILGLGSDEKDKVHPSIENLPKQKAIAEINSVQEVTDKLVRYADAGFPILAFTIFEEDKADEIITSVAGFKKVVVNNQEKINGRNIVEWSVLGFIDKGHNITKSNWSLSTTLQYMMRNPEDLKRTIFVLKDVHSLLEDSVIVDRLKYLAQLIRTGQIEDATIIIVSSILVIPKELENYMTIITMGYLSQKEIRHIIEEFCSKQELPALKNDFIEELTVALKGLSEFEIYNILTLAVSDDGEITRSDLKLIVEQKKQIIEKSGILEMVPVHESMNSIGGLENLKKWIMRKEKVFKNINQARSFGVDIPKGVLIVGMPGCGKSLTAKVTAKLFDVPLLRMDMGRLMGKYVGESEANMRKALQLAEAISPCVFWVDELEKAFAGVGNEGGGADITTRLFGIFLTWLQENESMVFVVATANDITTMPPELLRKGRFDEVFYIGMPNKKERKEILKIHIAKRRGREELNYIDLDKIVDATDGYSGADIEGVIKESVETAFTNEMEHIDTNLLMKTIKDTHSIKEMMGSSIDQMLQLYKKHKFKNATEDLEWHLSIGGV